MMTTYWLLIITVSILRLVLKLSIVDEKKLTPYNQRYRYVNRCRYRNFGGRKDADVYVLLCPTDENDFQKQMSGMIL